MTPCFMTYFGGNVFANIGGWGFDRKSLDLRLRGFEQISLQQTSGKSTSGNSALTPGRVVAQPPLT